MDIRFELAGEVFIWDSTIRRLDFYYVVHIEFDGSHIRIVSARRAEPDEEARYAL